MLYEGKNLNNLIGDSDNVNEEQSAVANILGVIERSCSERMTNYHRNEEENVIAVEEVHEH